MQLAILNKIKKYYGDRLILDIDKLEILEGHKIGLVGENGEGKTTLIKTLIGEEDIQEGNIYLTKSYAYISQKDDYLGTLDATKVKSLFNAPDEYEEFLSGGEKIKLKIARALSENKSLIIADEPTSNLDNNSVQVLEEMLKSYNGSLLLVSHDRNFLDALCNIIIEIKDSKIKIYNGNYSKYLELKQLEIERAKTEYNEYVEEKRRLQNAILIKRNLGDGIRRTPKRMGNSEARLHRMGGQKSKAKIDNSVKAIQSRIEHLDVKEKPKEIKEIKITIKEGLEITAKNPIEVKHLNLFVSNKLLLKDICFKVKNGKKVALIGNNGCGKSTLLNEIINNNNENIKISKNAVIGYFDQSQTILDENKSILENVRENCSFTESFVRIKLDGFGFKGDTVFKFVSKLSGGEKVKVALCKTLLSDNNILILDEPTNYLDIKSMQALETALMNTNKTLIIVSHDRKFISNVCDYIIEIENNTVKEFNGNYKDYIEFKNTPKISNKQHEAKDKLLVLENKRSELISLISIEKDDEKKLQLEAQYFSLSNDIKNLKI
ncbi:macrolide transport system ATP-binding/permease protein [Clostridium cavendishii DSM 21758]|uniref:Macrolide transport system ATP-binding/permease protein n=1 Tax=Clostridium cavendishii DSM 21758 TaxID=1121302 RepID=A0A1M6QZ05_9CLOT|nr:ABC-F type ribosomal protection protein CplR [Clostridium cavendishii]SHK25462.1 macrolide transport system ATP-binding/permease protein [Clostridium cavendishii DSM 21758]